jgi:hypothetical protein
MTTAFALGTILIGTFFLQCFVLYFSKKTRVIKIKINILSAL